MHLWPGLGMNTCWLDENVPTWSEVVLLVSSTNQAMLVVVREYEGDSSKLPIARHRHNLSIVLTSRARSRPTGTRRPITSCSLWARYSTCRARILVQPVVVAAAIVVVAIKLESSWRRFSERGWILFESACRHR